MWGPYCKLQTAFFPLQFMSQLRTRKHTRKSSSPYSEVHTKSTYHSLLSTWETLIKKSFLVCIIKRFVFKINNSIIYSLKVPLGMTIGFIRSQFQTEGFHGYSSLLPSEELESWFQKIPNLLLPTIQQKSLLAGVYSVFCIHRTSLTPTYKWVPVLKTIITW